jgi:hypothetical protein
MNYYNPSLLNKNIIWVLFSVSSHTHNTQQHIHNLPSTITLNSDGKIWRMLTLWLSAKSMTQHIKKQFLYPSNNTVYPSLGTVCSAFFSVATTRQIFRLQFSVSTTKVLIIIVLPFDMFETVENIFSQLVLIYLQCWSDSFANTNTNITLKLV